MIRRFLARRRLAADRRKRINSFAIQDFVRRREAMLKVTRRNRQAKG